MLCDARHIFHLDALADIARALSTSSPQARILDEILSILERRLRMARTTVTLLSGDRRELLVEEVRTGPSGHRENVRYRLGEGIIGRVVETGQSEIIPSIWEEPRFQDRIHARRKSGIAEKLSFICVPITIGQDTVGALSVDVSAASMDHLREAERVLRITASLIAGDVKNRRDARLQQEELTAENQRLRSALQEVQRPSNMIGDSGPMRAVYARMQQVAGADTTALIRGESGTGKELVATAIHFLSARSSQPLVKVNCAALNEGLLESELFGHEKGAFTGALVARAGRFEEADGGTLFLDEIGDFSPTIQVKLLRALQEREIQRVGSNKTVKANVRLICATNRDLEKAMQEGRFRPDLYYRINVFPVHLPPLRDRREDILPLANHFIAKYASRMGKPVRRINTPAINMLMAYHWPGNVRELENCIEHAVLLSRDGTIQGHDLPPTLQLPDDVEAAASSPLRLRVNQLERDLVVDALKRNQGSIRAAALELGITGRMVRYKIRTLNIPYDTLFKKRSSRRS